MPAIVRGPKVNYGKLRARATNRRTGPQIALNGPLGEIFVGSKRSNEYNCLIIMANTVCRPKQTYNSGCPVIN